IVFEFGGRLLTRDLDTGRTALIGPGRLPAYSPTGHLVFQSPTVSQDLWTQPFSLETLIKDNRTSLCNRAQWFGGERRPGWDCGLRGCGVREDCLGEPSRGTTRRGGPTGVRLGIPRDLA